MASNYPFGMRIDGIAAYAPPRMVTNKDIAEMLLAELKRVNDSRAEANLPPLTDDEAKIFRTQPAWIRRMIGFTGRRFAADGQGTIDLATSAGLLLNDQPGIDLIDVDAIIFGTVTPSYLNSPPDSIMLQHKLGIPDTVDGVPRDIFCIDSSLACSTWPSCLKLAYALIRSGLAKKVLIAGADKMSSTINWRDRAFACVLGDAGTVTLCSAVPAEEDWFGPELFWGWSCGERAMVIHTPVGGSVRPISTADELRLYLNRLTMDGATVKELFVPFMTGNGINAALAKAGWSLDMIDLVTMHEANRAQLNSVIFKNWQASGLTGQLVDANGEYGNTTTASVPLAVALHPDLYIVGKRFGWFGFGGSLSAAFAFGQIKHPIVLVTDVRIAA